MFLYMCMNDIPMIPNTWKSLHDMLVATVPWVPEAFPAFHHSETLNIYFGLQQIKLMEEEVKAHTKK